MNNTEIELGILSAKYDMLLQLATNAVRNCKVDSYNDKTGDFATLRGFVNVINPEPQKKKSLSATVQTAIEQIAEELTPETKE